MTEANQYFSIYRKHKKLTLAILASFLLVATIIAIVTVNSHNKSNKTHAALSLLMSTCSSTKYPELCYSSIAEIPEVVEKLQNKVDVLMQTINRTSNDVKSQSFALDHELAADKKLTPRQKQALEDCLSNNDAILLGLKKVSGMLAANPNDQTLQKEADDLLTPVSSCITNQKSCSDGFSHSKSDRRVRRNKFAKIARLFSGDEKDGGTPEKMCGVALSMINTFKTTDMEKELKMTNRKLKELERDSNEGWPEWLEVDDRRLLQSSALTPDVVVAADGSVEYRTVSAAVAAAPKNSSRRYIIKIKAGVYRENVEVPLDKINIMFVGDGRKTTIITGKRNVVDGSTTFHSATVAVAGDGFLARDITFQNTAGPFKYQAVALRVGSDHSAFYKCGFLGYQNTLYVHSNRQFFINCLITGTVDFIFGNSAAVFQDCDIHARHPKPGQKITVTAQGRSDPNQNTGIVVQKSRIGAASDLQSVHGNFSAYLGRPWQRHSRTIIMQSSLSDVINPAGWLEWKGNFAINSLYYAEYENNGPGAGTSERVNWKGYKVIRSATEAQMFTSRNFIAGSSWLRSTSFPYSLDL